MKLLIAFIVIFTIMLLTQGCVSLEKDVLPGKRLTQDRN